MLLPSRESSIANSNANINSAVQQPVIATPQNSGVSNTNVNQQTSTIKKSRLKSNLLELITEEVNITSQEEVKIVHLTPEVTSQLYIDFIQYLETQLQRNTAAQQLKLARVSLLSEKEVAILCSSEINKVMVNTQKDVFADYLKAQTKQPDIQIRIAMDENVVIEEQPVEVKRNKFDIFESMSQKNPVLIELRKSLNLIFE